MIVTRDSDYGLTLDNRTYVNDHLRQEFSERISQKRNILLYGKLSDALKHFKRAITPQEAKEEDEIVALVHQKKHAMEIAPDLVIELLGKFDLKDVPESRAADDDE